MIFERPAQHFPRPDEIASSIDRHNTANALVGWLFSVTGPLAIMLAVATKSGLTEGDISSWIFSGYGIGGIFSIVFSLIYRQPISMAWTIPGAILLVPALTHLSFSDVIGAYLATGLFILFLGVTGWIKKGMSAIPLPIVMGMVCGVFLPFCLKIITAFQGTFWIALSMVVVYVIMSAIPTLERLFPPLVGSLVVGVVVTISTGQVGLDQPLIFSVIRPTIYMPTLSIQALVELVIPLTITVVGIHNAQGLAILEDAGYEPPVNTLTAACGLGSIIFGIFGSVSTCVTGPVTGILNSSGKKENRYFSGVVFGTLNTLFGLFAPVAVRIGLALPTAFIGMLGGLSMIKVLQAAMSTAFTGRCALGALVTFLVTSSDVTIFNVGAAFWGLVFGFAASFLMERDDLRHYWKS